MDSFDSKYCYPNSNVLINHLNIRDAEKLHEAERKITLYRLTEIQASPIKGKFDFKHLQDIHRAIFQDIYPFAGRIREVAIAKSNLFCLPQFIRPMADEIFGKLHKDNCLRGLDKEVFIDRLAFYSGEINALHPFREGNGRTQRLFLQALSKAAGYQLLFAGMDQQMLLQADIEAMKGRYALLKELYREGIKDMASQISSPENRPSVLKQIEADRERRKSEKQLPPRKTERKRNEPER